MNNSLKVLLTATLMSASFTAFASNCMDTDKFYWQGDRRLDVYDKLVPILTCSRSADAEERAMEDSSACNWFLARALQDGFNVLEFTRDNGGWKTANQIARAVASSSQWEHLGNASKQSSLTKAQEAAAKGLAVLAVESGDPHGHVALILRGPLKRSGTWGLDVPNSASAFLDRAERSYVGCSLSYAFRVGDGVEIYARKD